MSADRYVVLGLAQVRAEWFREVSQWSTSAALPLEFVKAMSLEEVSVRLQSGRSYSALLVEDTTVGLDRDLVHSALDAGCAVIVVDGGRVTKSWIELGASAVLPIPFGPDDLLHVVSQVASPVTLPGDPTPERSNVSQVGFRGTLIGVTGSGGTGASTVAMALAQGLAADPRQTGLVCLGDLSLNAEMAMLHGAHDIVPGLTELVEAHRSGEPSAEVIRSLTWQVEARGYHLLLGLRRHRDWTAVRPRALAEAIDSLQRGFRFVVVDFDGDLEGEKATGSADVQDRNLLARTAASTADLVVAVGSPHMKGLHSLLRTIRDLLDHDVPTRRILPVLNEAPRSPRARAELTRAFGELLSSSVRDRAVPSPVFLPHRRRLDLAIRDGHRLPDAWLGAITQTARALTDGAHTGHRDQDDDDLVPIAPGSLGHWTDQEVGG